MISEKFKELIDKLLVKTENKTALWSKTSRENEYKLILSKGAITTDKWTNINDESEMIDFVIWNENGENIENIFFNESLAKNEYEYLKRLHDAARRSFLKVDETIDNIFKEISSEKIIGKGNKESDLPF